MDHDTARQAMADMLSPPTDRQYREDAYEAKDPYPVKQSQRSAAIPALSSYKRVLQVAEKMPHHARRQELQVQAEELRAQQEEKLRQESQEQEKLREQQQRERFNPIHRRARLRQRDERLDRLTLLNNKRLAEGLGVFRTYEPFSDTEEEDDETAEPQQQHHQDIQPQKEEQQPYEAKIGTADSEVLQQALEEAEQAKREAQQALEDAEQAKREAARAREEARREEARREQARKEAALYEQEAARAQQEAARAQQDAARAQAEARVLREPNKKEQAEALKAFLALKTKSVGIEISGGVIEDAGTQGMLVQTVVPGGSADRCGLRDNDLITSVDGKECTAKSAGWGCKPLPGDVLPLSMHRPGEGAVNCSLAFEAENMSHDEMSELREKAGLPMPLTGDSQADGELAQRQLALMEPASFGFGLNSITDEDGNTVLEVGVVEEGGGADEAGLQVKDIITGCDGMDVLGPQDLKRVKDNCQSGQVISFEVLRDGEPAECLLTVGGKRHRTADVLELARRVKGMRVPPRLPLIHEEEEKEKGQVVVAGAEEQKEPAEASQFESQEWRREVTNAVPVSESYGQAGNSPCDDGDSEAEQANNGSSHHTRQPGSYQHLAAPHDSHDEMCISSMSGDHHDADEATINGPQIAAEKLAGMQPALGIKLKENEGDNRVFFKSVAAGQAFERAGVQEDDALVAVRGEHVTGLMQVYQMFQDRPFKTGDVLPIRVSRDSREYRVNVVIGAKDVDYDRVMEIVSSVSPSGVFEAPVNTLIPIDGEDSKSKGGDEEGNGEEPAPTPRHRRKASLELIAAKLQSHKATLGMNLVDQIGENLVRVGSVVDGQAFHTAGIRANDLLVTLRGEVITSVETLSGIYQRSRPKAGDVLPITLCRGGRAYRNNVVAGAKDVAYSLVMDYVHASAVHKGPLNTLVPMDQEETERLFEAWAQDACEEERAVKMDYIGLGPEDDDNDDDVYGSIGEPDDADGEDGGARVVEPVPPAAASSLPPAAKPAGSPLRTGTGTLRKAEGFLGKWKKKKGLKVKSVSSDGAAFHCGLMVDDYITEAPQGTKLLAPEDFVRAWTHTKGLGMLPLRVRRGTTFLNVQLIAGMQGWPWEKVMEKRLPGYSTLKLAEKWVRFSRKKRGKLKVTAVSPGFEHCGLQIGDVVRSVRTHSPSGAKDAFVAACMETPVLDALPIVVERKKDSKRVAVHVNLVLPVQDMPWDRVTHLRGLEVPMASDDNVWGAQRPKQGGNHSRNPTPISERRRTGQLDPDGKGGPPAAVQKRAALRQRQQESLSLQRLSQSPRTPQPERQLKTQLSINTLNGRGEKDDDQEGEEEEQAEEEEEEEAPEVISPTACDPPADSKEALEAYTQLRKMQPDPGMTLEFTKSPGFRIRKIVAKGSADKAGLKPGDVVYQWGAHTPRARDERAWRNHVLNPASVGDQVPLKVRRGTQSINTVLMLGDKDVPLREVEKLVRKLDAHQHRRDDAYRRT